MGKFIFHKDFVFLGLVVWSWGGEETFLFLHQLSRKEIACLQGKKFPTCLAVQVLIGIAQLLAFFLLPLA